METTTLSFIGNLGAGELIILSILFIPAVFWIWALIDLLTSKFSNSIEKLIWLIAIIFIPVLGAILYLMIGRRQKRRDSPL
ncbi:PLD nuclease N-terminal domain-containing protein [Rufibacter sp. XAAS-G3-1]|uniref:PLD nuclease N-terminal domain-containing protein n=1 Tax=Rufibacter sp. XAAS-G3-1 TaxID=2729134 RepID=UPI0015E77C25|nr:PLD nuclease N-terminal domain-containing protein [Rufibacter sp. XAAS-G3-1]